MPEEILNMVLEAQGDSDSWIPEEELISEAIESAEMNSDNLLELW